jgi:16S rRNA (guanine527-N7)-methyltransferase
MELILKYFPHLTDTQFKQFEQLQKLYEFWNERINVISRKDIENIYEKHILHSLAVAYKFNFNPGTLVLDVGTGGGFPGIPLAIMFPEARFTLVDSIGKKINVVNEIAKTIELRNITTIHARAESLNIKFNFVVSRAVTEFPEFVQWVKNLFLSGNKNSFKNGIIYLKGGDLKDELKNYSAKTSIINISEFFDEPFFETKKIVYLPMVK